jgi:hypothetical protein
MQSRVSAATPQSPAKFVDTAETLLGSPGELVPTQKYPSKPGLDAADVPSENIRSARGPPAEEDQAVRTVRSRLGLRPPAEGPTGESG